MRALAERLRDLEGAQRAAGPLHRLARRSRELWLEVLRASGLWHTESGSLHLAYHDDEAEVLREFVGQVDPHEYRCELLTPRRIRERAPAVREEGLRVGLWSPLEVGVDPREVVARVPSWLAHTYGVDFAFDTPAAITNDGFAYVVTFWSSTGQYNRTPNAFLTPGLDTTSLHAYYNGESGAVNGTRDAAWPPR